MAFESQLPLPAPSWVRYVFPSGYQASQATSSISTGAGGGRLYAPGIASLDVTAPSLLAQLSQTTGGSFKGIASLGAGNRQLIFRADGSGSGDAAAHLGILHYDGAPANLNGAELPAESRVFILDLNYAFDPDGTGDNSQGFALYPRTGAIPASMAALWPSQAGANGGGVCWVDAAGVCHWSWYSPGGVLEDDVVLPTAVGAYPIPTQPLRVVMRMTEPNREPTAELFAGTGLPLLGSWELGTDLPRMLDDAPGYTWGWAYRSNTTTGLVLNFQLRWGRFLPDGTPVGSA